MFRVWFRVVAISLFLCSNVCAQSQASDEAQSSVTDTFSPLALPEVVIHGSLFKQTQSEAPVSATVVSGAIIEERGDPSFQETVEQVPSLNWAGGSNRPRFFQIRGIGELEQYEGAPNPSVGILIDDIDFSGLGAPISLFDVEQVEVFRGPQATEFGSDALAGIINIKSVDPSPYLSGRGELVAGSDNLMGGGFAAGGPVWNAGDVLQARVSVYQSYEDGFRDNVYLGEDDTNKRDELTSKLKVRVKPNDNLQIDFTLLYVDADNGYDAFTIDNNYTTESDRPGKDSLAASGAAIKVTQNLGDGYELRSTSTGLDASQDYDFDGDWGNNIFWAPYAPYDYFSRNDRDRTNVSQELRLSYQPKNYLHGDSYRSVVGVYGQHLKEDTDTRQYSDDEEYDALVSNYKQNTYAIFGEVEFPIVTGTSLVTAGRSEWRESTYEDSRGADYSPTYNMLGGSVTLNHDLQDNIRVYGLTSRGFKGGGFNTGTSIPDKMRIYDPEYLYNFEIGTKSNWFDRSLDTNIAVFHALRRDQQLEYSYQNDPSDPLSFTYVTDNAASGYTQGIELESVWHATMQTTFRFAGDLLRTEFSDVDVDSTTLEGREAAHAPNWQYATSVRQQFTEHWFGLAEIVGKDAYYFDDINDQRSDPYHLLNLSLGYEQTSWSWTLWVKNVCDKHYAVRGFYFGDEPPDYPNKLYEQLGDPRQFGTTLNFYF